MYVLLCTYIHIHARNCIHSIGQKELFSYFGLLGSSIQYEAIADNTLIYELILNTVNECFINGKFQTNTWA